MGFVFVLVGVVRGGALWRSRPFDTSHTSTNPPKHIQTHTPDAGIDGQPVKADFVHLAYGYLPLAWAANTASWGEFFLREVREGFVFVVIGDREWGDRRTPWCCRGRHALSSRHLINQPTHVHTHTHTKQKQAGNILPVTAATFGINDAWAHSILPQFAVSPDIIGFLQVRAHVCVWFDKHADELHTFTYISLTPPTLPTRTQAVTLLVGAGCSVALTAAIAQRPLKDLLPQIAAILGFDLLFALAILGPGNPWQP